jgi:hypothetical protein
MHVMARDGAMAVDIPGQTLLALNDPDEQSRWYAKLTDRVFFTFDRNDVGEVTAMQVHEIVRMQRTGDPEQVDTDVPERFRPYLGTYLLAQLNAEFTVIYRDGSLAVNDPLENAPIGLQLPDVQGRWVDEFDKNAISFEREEDGAFMTMVVDAANSFQRDPAPKR